MRLSYSLTRLKILITGLKEMTLWSASMLKSALIPLPLGLDDIIQERDAAMGIEDMWENDQVNNSEAPSHFARCNLSWFKENMNQGSEGHTAQTWTPVAWDSSGASIIKVHRAIAKKVEVWYRVSSSKSDAIFEKRIEYPEGVDEDEQY